MTLNLTFLLVRISQNITRTTEPIPTNWTAMFSNFRTSAWAASNSLQSRDIIFEVNFLPFCRHRCSSILSTFYCFLANNAVDLCQNFSKCILYIGGLQSWGFHEVKWFFLSIRLPIFCCHCYQVPKVWFVSNKHHHNVSICVVSQLFQPSVNILECCMPSHIVHQKCTHCAAVVCTGDRTIPTKRNTVNQKDAGLWEVWLTWYMWLTQKNKQTWLVKQPRRIAFIKVMAREQKPRGHICFELE